jgi:hypothetical protein
MYPNRASTGAADKHGLDTTGIYWLPHPFDHGFGFYTEGRFLSSPHNLLFADRLTQFSVGFVFKFGEQLPGSNI